ncbi:X-box-binding protein 1-like [Dysidea avara]|uniref:X-box-binding protein 1-like n=1 Tax=Dysidea avara TaxID=196820 RepID=UPI00331779E3
MSDSVVPKRLVPYALVSPLQPHKSDDGQPQNESRKRKRVADMTSEERAEKQLKRKMRNRVASQNTRDKRRQYVTDLELQVQRLQEKNEALSRENQLLKQRTDSLLSANTILASSEVIPVGHKQGVVSIKSAVFGEVSQQKKPQTSFPLSATLINILTILSVTYCHYSLDTHRRVLPQSVVRRHSRLSSYLMNRQHLLRVQKWWGAQQSHWNPPKN